MQYQNLYDIIMGINKKCPDVKSLLFYLNGAPLFTADFSKTLSENSIDLVKMGEEAAVKFIEDKLRAFAFVGTRLTDGCPLANCIILCSINYEGGFGGGGNVSISGRLKEFPSCCGAVILHNLAATWTLSGWNSKIVLEFLKFMMGMAKVGQYSSINYVISKEDNPVFWKEIDAIKKEYADVSYTWKNRRSLGHTCENLIKSL